METKQMNRNQVNINSNKVERNTEDKNKSNAMRNTENKKTSSLMRNSESKNNSYGDNTHKVDDTQNNDDTQNADDMQNTENDINGSKEKKPAKDNDSKKDQENEKLKKENEDLKDKKISEFGQTLLENGNKDHKIHLLSIIGEIEGHEVLPQHNKTTKYEHVLPQLAAIEDSSEIDGLLILINTVGGDVEAGLAIAEMIASLSKPTVSLVLGGSHSIGVPLAVSADYSYIVPTATMIIHPVRMNGTVIGVTQTFEYFERIQDRIIRFVVDHSHIDYPSFKNLMLDTSQLAKDVGSILVGEETVTKGIINEVGGIKEALGRINEMIDSKQSSS